MQNEKNKFEKTRIKNEIFYEYNAKLSKKLQNKNKIERSNIVLDN